MAAKPLVPDKKTEYFKVDSRRLVVEEGYNERENFGDIDQLVRSIRAGGIKTPLRVYKRGEEYVVRTGHRRTMALRILEKEMVPIMVPIFLVPKGYNPEIAVLDLIVENDSLRLSPWEQAKVLRRLRNFGWEEDRMVEESGLTLNWVRRLLSLVDAPQKLIDLVQQGRVKGTFAIDMIAEGRVEELLQKAAENNLPQSTTEMELFPAPPTGPKPDKITRSDLKPNSWKAFRKWSKGVDENNLPKKKVETFKFLKQIEEGNLKEDDFIEFFK